MNSTKKKWWQDKVAYQIYPKSFYDTNGDGIGDLPGIIEKLDYLKELGVDIVWLSPCYRSPLADQGYDISDYYDIDPRFGTMEDMDRLIAEAKKRDMYIVMDLVVNHCSDEHEWFKKACKDPDGKYGRFFYLRDKEDGKLPTNWRSYFGGSVWEDLPGTNKQYLHVFHKKQPDLNWENPELREEVYKNINWWLDKGLGGFRIDAIINIKKALPMHDYEPDREDGLCSINKMLEEASGIGEFLGEMRDRTFKPHDAFSVGEVFNAKDEELPDFIGNNGYFSSMFDFNETIFGGSEKGWYDCKEITPDDYKRCCFETQAKMGDFGFSTELLSAGEHGWYDAPDVAFPAWKKAIFHAQDQAYGCGFESNIIENHDEPRGVSHYIPEGDCCDTSKKMLAALNFMLRGLPFIYQGQELGMENIPFKSIDEVDDISTLDEYKVALDAGLTPEAALKAVARRSRDNARTPMQWTGEENAGFTAGTPWLRVNSNYTAINVEKETIDPNSVLNFYKKLIALRKDPEYKETVVYGALEPFMEDRHNLMAYYRKGDKTLLVVGNYQWDEQEITLPSECKKVLINNYPDMVLDGNLVKLHGYQVLVVELA